MNRARAAAATLALAALACDGPPEAPRQPAQVSSVALRAFDRAPSVPVMIATRDLDGARSLAEALAVPRPPERLPVVTATLTRAQLEHVRRRPDVRAIALDDGGRGHLAQALPLAGFAPVQTAGLRGAGITVAVIDSGITRAHPDLAGAVRDEACFCASGCCPGGAIEAFGEGSAPDESGHGTHVAGIIASRGVESGQPGGAPAVEVIAIKILDSTNAFCCTSDLIAAIDWLLTAHPEVDVVNMSFGANGLFEGDCDGDAQLAPLAAAMNAIIEAGAVVVASSGNNGSPSSMAAPACLSRVVSAGAVWDEDIGPEAILCSEPMTAPDRIACFSNASATLDVLAPGALVTSTWPVGGTRGRAGTSQAAPMVSACAAALLEAFPDASVAAITSALRSSPTLLSDARNGGVYPRLDCGAALLALSGIDGGIEDAGALDASAALDAAALDDAALDDAAGPWSDAALTDGAASLDGALELDAASDVDAASYIDAGLTTEPRDAGARADAGSRDDAAATSDAAGPGDSGAPARSAARGSDCGCRAPGMRSTHRFQLASYAWLLAAYGLSRRRKRRRSWKAR